MDVFNDLGQGIVTIPTVQNVLFLGAGVIMGMVVGVMPGLGPSAGLAILLPITFSLDPTGAVVMLAAVYYGAMYGGTITSVLINTPASPPRWPVPSTAIPWRSRAERDRRSSWPRSPRSSPAPSGRS